MTYINSQFEGLGTDLKIKVSGSDNSTKHINITERQAELIRRILNKEPINPIGYCDFFATPESMDNLLAMLERYQGGEKIAALTAYGMTWNLAHKVVKEAHEKAGA